MAKDGEVKSSRDHDWQSFVWHLPTHDYPKNYFNRQHELDCADLFVAFYNAGFVEHWDQQWTLEEQKEAQVHRVYYDRRLIGMDKLFYIEVDRGTEDDQRLEEKLTKYRRYSERNPDLWFYVLITIQGYRSSVNTRAENILKILKKLKLPPYHYLVARHADVLKDPLGKIWGKWDIPMHPVSLLSLRK